ncbi:MAG: COX15/CtaA family protein [Cellvibrionaceae bacterium]
MLTRKDIEHKTLFKLALSAFVLAIFVVILGAFTRLVDAGLGCPDWPGCYGHLLWPNESHEIIKAEKAFPDAPVELEKTWPEMVHRYFAGTLGLFILAIVIMSIRYSTQQKKLLQPSGQASSALASVPVKLPLFLLALVILQAAFGMWTVTLKLWPKVVTAHLLGGFATLSLLWLLVQRLGLKQWQVSEVQYHALRFTRPLIVFSLVVVIIQIALGGWVSSNYAALACPDLPQCLGQWLPPTDFKAGFNVWQDIGPNYLGGQLDNHARTAIHLTHRIGALIVTFTLLILGFRLLSIRSAQVKSWVWWLWGVLAVQVSLGLANILFALPLAIAVAHNAVGAVLLLTMVTITYRSFKPVRS